MTCPRSSRSPTGSRFSIMASTRLNGTVAEVMAADDDVFKRFLAGKAAGEENETALAG